MMKRSKSGLLPQLFSRLSPDEKQQVEAAMNSYNTIYADHPYYEPEQFYQVIFRRGWHNFKSTKN